MEITVDKELETNVVVGFSGARKAAIDAQMRSKRAEEIHEDFFADPNHWHRVEQTKNIVKKFFKCSVYVNQRGLGRTKPFTVVKVERPLFPNHLTKAQKDAMLYDPLKAIGVEVVFAKGSNSYLFRVK